MLEKIKAIINEVKDSKLNKKVGELNLLKNVKIEDKNIDIFFEVIPPLQTLQCSTGNEIENQLKNEFPEYEINVHIDEKDSIENKARVSKNIKNLIAVASGKGGVGKSTVTANLAIAFAKTGAKVAILDADIYGPSQPLMYGLKNQTMEAYEKDGQVLAIPLENYGVKVVSMGFALQENQAAILRGPMLAGYFTLLFEQVDWGEIDFLFFDMPPGTGDIQLTMTQKVPLTGAVIVTTPQEVSLIDVRRSIDMFNKVNINVLGIIENMSYFTPPDLLDKKYYIFGEGGGKEIANDLKIPFLGEIPISMQIREAADNGKPITAEDNQTEAGKSFDLIAHNILNEMSKLETRITPEINM